jgi:two-component system CheB/CheR fusion protein
MRDNAVPLRILVVDDDADTLAALTRLLIRWGYETRTARDGPEALAAAASFRPDVALLDLGLPGMDGYELAHRLRELPDLADICLMALTGFGSERYCWMSGRAGFAFHLAKPAEPAAIEAALDVLADERAARGRRAKGLPDRPRDSFPSE